MKLIGNLKKQVEETNSKEEAKEIIEKAGMQLTDEELDNVAGGKPQNGGCQNGNHDWEHYIDTLTNQMMKRCKNCGTTLPISVTSI